MPSEKGDKMAISLWVDKEVVEKLDYIAEKGGLTRSKLIANLLECAVHDLMILDKTGFIRLAVFYHDMRDAIKNMKTNFSEKQVLATLFKKKEITK
jgi:metal-responsive CopG/Arc/MetJ family transcriptional regulator